MKMIPALMLGLIGIVGTVTVGLALRSAEPGKIVYQLVGRNIGVQDIDDAGIRLHDYAWRWGYLAPNAFAIYSDDIPRTPPEEVKIFWTVQDESLEQVMAVPVPPVGPVDEDRILRVEFDPEKKQVEVFWTTELFPDSKHRGPGS
ncbi:MAG: hypothetical protein R3F12_00005 [Lysobacteraceae bacterium]